MAWAGAGAGAAHLPLVGPHQTAVTGANPPLIPPLSLGRQSDPTRPGGPDPAAQERPDHTATEPGPPRRSDLTRPDAADSPPALLL